MSSNRTNQTLDENTILASSYVSTIQLVTSVVTPCLEVARILLSIVIFLLVHFSPLYRTTSFGVHIRCLAIYDAGRISERFFYWFPPLTAFMLKFKYARCNFAFFLQNFFSHTSTVTIALLSIERFVILWSPFRARYLASVRQAILIQLINTFLMFIVTHFYLIPNYFQSMDYTRCYYSTVFRIYNSNLIFDYKIYTMIDIVLFSLVPCLVTIVSIILIIIGLKRHRKHQKYLRANQVQQQPTTSIYETSIILISIALLQVTTTFPLRMLSLLNFFISIDPSLFAGLYYILSFNELLASTLSFLAFVLPFQNIRTEFNRVFFSFCFLQRQRFSLTTSTTPRIAVISSRP